MRLWAIDDLPLSSRGLALEEAICGLTGAGGSVTVVCMNHAGLHILRRQHWVFDLDGTLTVPVHDFAAIRKELGIPETADILDHLESLPEAAARPLFARLQEIENSLAELTRPAAGVDALIEHLHARGARLGILTRNTRTNALATLDKIGVGRYFPAPWVLGRNEARPKPSPEGVLKLMAYWGTDASDVVMVGDYLYDLQTGRSAGAATVHIDTSQTFRWPEFTDITAASLAELITSLPVITTGPLAP